MSRIESGYNASQELAEQYRLQHQQKEDLQSSHETEMENLKRSHQASKADLEDRFESSYQSERLNHYENLKKMKAQVQREERDLEARGKESIHNKSRELEAEAFRTDQEGRSRVDDTRRKFAALEQYERQKQQSLHDELHEGHLKNTDLILKRTEKATNDLREQKEAYLEVQKENHRAVLEGIQDHYQKIRDEKNARYLDELRDIEHRTTASLNERKLASAEKIRSHETRAADPFYRIRQFETDLQDHGEDFVLRVKVPEHERKGLRVQVSGNDLELIGTRSTDERARVAPGRVVSTRAHQIVSERFTLPAPVDPKSVSVGENGEWLEYRITKYGPHHTMNEPLAVYLNQEQSPIARELGFVESLPRPSVLNSSSGKGTLG
jgi:HSP20 family molecular chaperone IbpA